MGQRDPRTFPVDSSFEKKWRWLNEHQITAYFNNLLGEKPTLRDIGDLSSGIKNGIDYLAHFPNNPTRSIEVKTRRLAFDDLAVEYQSNNGEITRVGWFWSSKAEYLAYTVLGKPITTTFVTFRHLHERLNKTIWTYPRRSSQNKGYRTFFVIVPWSHLPEAHRLEYNKPGRRSR